MRKGRVDVYVQYYWKGGGEGLHAWAERGRLREREREMGSLVQRFSDIRGGYLLGQMNLPSGSPRMILWAILPIT